MGRCAHPLNRYVIVFYTFFITEFIHSLCDDGFPRPPSMQTPSTHAEHESTPLLVSFRVLRCSFALLHMLNVKRHQRGCLFVFSVVPSPYTTCRMRKDTNEGVFSCSALFLHPTPHAERKKTPTRVSFRVRRCSFALHHMQNAKRHPRGCLFVFGVVPSPYTTC